MMRRVERVCDAIWETGGWSHIVMALAALMLALIVS